MRTYTLTGRDIDDGTVWTLSEAVDGEAVEFARFRGTTSEALDMATDAVADVERGHWVALDGDTVFARRWVAHVTDPWDNAEQRAEREKQTRRW